MDWFYAHSPRSAGGRRITAKRVACIGAGPASLACAAELRRAGFAVTIFDRNPLAGGLNTYGIAEYKLRPADSLKEVELVRSMGVEFRLGVEVADDRAARRAISTRFFLAWAWARRIGLNIPGEDLPGVIDALRFIADYKTGSVAIGRRVAVIGAGNTAIDAATAAHAAGRRARSIFFIAAAKPRCRRSNANTNIAKLDGIDFHWWARPVRIHGGADGGSDRVPDGGGRSFDLTVRHGDPVHRAIAACRFSGAMPRRSADDGRVVINRETGQTANPKYFAGGDCVNGGREVVDAVADGKRAGIWEWRKMADLTTLFAGKIRCPNPFWLASGPPANCGDQVMRAFDAGWGGAVWKTLGEPDHQRFLALQFRRLERPAHDGAE